VLLLFNVGSSLSLRNNCNIASELSVMGTGVSDIPFQLYNPLSLRQTMPCGASLSVFGVVRFGSTLSVLDCVSLGSSLSLRSKKSLGSTLSVFDIAVLGASLSLRSFARLGASLSIFARTQFGSTLSMYDGVSMAPGKVVAFPGGWTISYDAANSKMEFRKNAGNPAFVITPTGGNLHGTWHAESIISASDRRLKRGIEPLYRSLLRGKQRGAAEAAREQPSGWPAMTASGLLALLRPSGGTSSLLGLLSGGLGGASNQRAEKQGFSLDAEGVAQALPDVVRESPRQGGKMVAYQDLLAVVTLAAKERQRRLELHEQLEKAEEEELRRQGDLLEALEGQADRLLGRFARLRQTSFGAM